MGESKRRLTADQVRTLEVNFDEEEGKLEPEKKIHLAQALGLQPRQVAVWFQNRRVRSRNKQLEKDFDVLKRDYEALKTNYDNLIQETKKLQSEVRRLSCSGETSICVENRKPDSASEGIVKRETQEPNKVKKDVLLENKQCHGSMSQLCVENSPDSLWCTDYWQSHDLWQG